MKIKFNSNKFVLTGEYSENKSKVVYLILHPHTLYGGNINTKIIYKIHKFIFNNGYTTMRFNFQGALDSQGSYDNGNSETQNIIDAIKFIKNINPKSVIVPIGFSFGSYAMFNSLNILKLPYFISIGTPSSMFDIQKLNYNFKSGLFIHGTNDEIIKLKDFILFFNSNYFQNQNTKYSIIKNANHFFDEPYTKNLLDVINKFIIKNNLNI